MQIETGPLDIIDRNHWEAFRLKYPGDEHLRLACHAAFPVALTPDLLYKIWLNFRQPESTTEPLELLTSVSDILRSPLCREIGRDIYEMHPDIRTALLEALQNDSENGHERILDLARFLRDYLRHNPDKLPSASFREAQNWVAESYLEPEKAAKTILDLLEQEDQDINAAHKVDFFLSWTKQRNHLQRSAFTDNTGADVLLATEEIVQGFRQYRVGDMEGALERFRYIEPFVEAGDGNGKGFKATIPGEVWQAMHKPVTAQAKQRSLAFELIEKEKRERTGVLDLGNCGLTEVPEEVFELGWLEELVLSNEWYDWQVQNTIRSQNTGNSNNIWQLSIEFEKLQSLKKLVLGGNFGNKWGIQDIEPLSYLPNLAILYLHMNKVSNLAPLHKLNNLMLLDISSNEISDISPIHRLNNLKTLAFASNRFSTIAPILKLFSIEELYLDNNQVVDLQPLKKLTSLRILNCKHNKIKDLEPLKKLTSLTSLDFSYNKVNDLQPIENVKSLIHLAFTDNKITDLSPIENLTNLVFLSFGGNKVADLTPIKNLTGLKTLALSGNLISDLRPIEKLADLTFLNLRANQVSDLSPILFLLKKGLNIVFREPFSTQENEINISENHILLPPLEIVRQGSEATIKYLSQINTNTEIEFYEANIFILGEAGSGKTSLKRKIFDISASINTIGDSTRGLDIQKWEYATEDNKICRVNLFDFGGQEVYHDLQRIFFSENSLFILVVDSRTQSSIQYWLENIQMYGGESPVLIVRNKIDIESNIQLNENALMKRYSFLNSFYSTSLLTTIGIDEIIKGIKINLQKLPGFGAKVSTQWLTIRQEVDYLSISKKYIQINKWLDICKNNNLEHEAALVLSNYFHRIGIFLHFQSDPQLSNIIYLDKNWICELIYLLKKGGGAVNSRGFFNKSSLRDIWESQDIEDYDLLMVLMEKFELCFRLLDKKDEWLFPSLLPSEKPKYEWNSSNNLLLHYQYDSMPIDILSRIVVRLHHLIPRPELVWRRGVIFEHLGAVAEVIESVKERNIIIAVRGSEQALCKELLIVIVEEFDKLHASLLKIKVEKLIPCVCNKCVSSEEPYLYKYSDLTILSQNGKSTVQCKYSFEDVEIINMLELLNMFDLDFVSKMLGSISVVGEQYEPIKNFNEKIFSNYTIKKYLEIGAHDTALFLVGAKGTGKSTLLRQKSFLYRNSLALKGKHPESSDELVERLVLNHGLVSKKDLLKFKGLDIWCEIWNYVLSIVVLKTYGLDRFPKAIQTFHKSYNISTILSEIMLDRKNIYNLLKLLPALKDELIKIQSGISFFIDSIDLAFSDILINSYSLDYPSSEGQLSALELWSNSQIGFIDAAYTLNRLNSHIKIYSTIRIEAIKLSKSHHLINYQSYMTTLQYSKKEIQEILEIHIKNAFDDKIEGANLDFYLKKLFGFNEIPHPFAKSTVSESITRERIFDYLYRHTYGRPREIIFLFRMLYDKVLSHIEYKSQSQDEKFSLIRQVVNDASYELFEMYRSEIVPLFEMAELNEFIGQLTTNYIKKEEIQKFNPSFIKTLYNYGLLGYVEKSKFPETSFIQRFLPVAQYNYNSPRNLPSADFYVIHPTLNKEIVKTKGHSYYSQLSITNISGVDYQFYPPNKF